MTVASPSPALAAPDARGAEAALRARGLRLTSSRRLVIAHLFAADGPVTASALAGGLGGELPRLDPAVVYRTLETLEELGLVRHVHAGHGPGLYVLAGRDESEFLHCERCGTLRAVRPAVLAAARERVRQATGFEARFSHFPLVGTCADCA